MHGLGGPEPVDDCCLSGDFGATPAAPAVDASAGGSNGKPDDAARPTAPASRDDAPGDATGTGDAGRRYAETPASAESGPRPTRQEVTAGVAPEGGGR